MTERKGIILAGGSGTRLYPLTIGVSKQLLPVYDKPMIYYPLTVLMLAGIREILIITTPDDLPQYKCVLGDGSQWGITLNYKQQPSPDGLAQAFILAEDFLDGAPSALILGDNIFFGHGLPQVLAAAYNKQKGATVFGYHVNDPERYGVVGFDNAGKVNSIIEKPKEPASNYAVTGLYFVDGTAPKRAKKVQPSSRGELEITSLLENYLKEDNLTIEKLGRGFAWLDTGTHGSLLDAANFVRTITERQGLQIGSPDEVAFKLKWISREKFLETITRYSKSKYGQYLAKINEKEYYED
jgi:glucose-1-phosphate thymidylyltransferase